MISFSICSFSSRGGPAFGGPGFGPRFQAPGVRYSYNSPIFIYLYFFLFGWKLTRSLLSLCVSFCRSLSLSGFVRPPPNLGDPMSGRMPPNAWAPISPQNHTGSSTKDSVVPSNPVRFC